MDVSGCSAVRPPRRPTCETPELATYPDIDIGRLRDDALFNAESLLMDSPQSCADLCMRYPSCLVVTYQVDTVQCPDGGPDYCCDTCPDTYYRCVPPCPCLLYSMLYLESQWGADSLRKGYVAARL